MVISHCSPSQGGSIWARITFFSLLISRVPSDTFCILFYCFLLFPLMFRYWSAPVLNVWISLCCLPLLNTWSHLSLSCFINFEYNLSAAQTYPLTCTFLNSISNKTPNFIQISFWYVINITNLSCPKIPDA